MSICEKCHEWTNCSECRIKDEALAAYRADFDKSASLIDKETGVVDRSREEWVELLRITPRPVFDELHRLATLWKQQREREMRRSHELATLRTTRDELLKILKLVKASQDSPWDMVLFDEAFDAVKNLGELTHGA